jgi:hypothetical protein
MVSARQPKLLGSQARATQVTVSASHLCPSPHGSSSSLAPDALQVTMAAPSHLTSSGSHTRETHEPESQT